MNTREAVVKRIQDLCAERDWSINHLAYVSGVSQSTLKSIILGESKNPTIISIKMMCDGFGITLREFFSTPYFDSLEQELK